MRWAKTSRWASRSSAGWRRVRIARSCSARSSTRSRTFTRRSSGSADLQIGLTRRQRRDDALLEARDIELLGSGSDEREVRDGVLGEPRELDERATAQLHLVELAPPDFER